MLLDSLGLSGIALSALNCSSYNISYIKEYLLLFQCYYKRKSKLINLTYTGWLYYSSYKLFYLEVQ
jgi:hypothetical protein